MNEKSALKDQLNPIRWPDGCSQLGSSGHVPNTLQRKTDSQTFTLYQHPEAETAVGPLDSLNMSREGQPV